MSRQHVTGKNKGRIMLYGLSTCIWCRKTKTLLDQLGVDYEWVEVDLLQGEERTKTTEEVKNLNPRCSFPTLAINDQCIVGFDQERIEGALR